MSKLIHHTWERTTQTTDFNRHRLCPTCKCEKFYSAGHKKLVYIDRFGKMHYRAPSCVLPNTKL